MTTVSPYTPSLLRQAIQAQDPERVLGALQTNSCPDIENGVTNLVLAMMHCPHHSQLIAPLIVGRGLDVLEFADEYGNTPIIVAASRANVVAIDLLAQAGASVCAHNKKFGFSPLHQVLRFGLLNVRGMIDDPAHAHAQVLKAARALIRHGALADDYSSHDGQALVIRYIKDWIPEGDPNLVNFLVAEGAAAPSKEEVLKVNPAHAEKINVAIEEGLACRQVRAALTIELGGTMPAPLVALIRDYVS